LTARQSRKAAKRPRSEAQPSEVIVVGSGGAALVAALAAADAGARVAVLEKTAQIGGTTGMSGGLVWVPCNPQMAAEGEPDDEAAALTYLRTLAAGRSEEALLRAVLASGPEMVRFLERATTLRFETLDKPDYHPELPGARRSRRCLAPNVFERARLGEWGERVRTGAIYSLPMSWREFDAMNAAFHPERLDLRLVEERFAKGLVGMGTALVSHLLLACLERGIEVLRETRAVELLLEAEAGRPPRVRGVVARRTGGEAVAFAAERGVILACGGFEWNPELVRRFSAGPVAHPLSNPANEGDGLRMAMAAGADLANMYDLLRFPAANIPGELYDGRPLARMVVGERGLPHAILVNRRGRRFVNEAHNYTDVARAYGDFDPVAYEFANHPSFAIFDAQFRAQYSVLGVPPGAPEPEGVLRAGSLRELAAQAGIDADGLGATVARWNGFVREGRDRDFRRGESFFDTYYADMGREPSATLGSIERPPFFALRVGCGVIGTNGGPRTDAHGRVQHVSGEPIPGLYACGDAAASAIGPGYGGPGGPLGQGFSMGFRAGRHAAGETR